MGDCGFDEHGGADDVDGVEAGEVFGGQGAEGFVVRDAGVVDDDVDLQAFAFAEDHFRGFDDLFGARGGAHVRLHGDGVDVMVCLQFFGEVGGALRAGVGGVVEEEGAAFAGEVGGYGGANTWMRGGLVGVGLKREGGIWGRGELKKFGIGKESSFLMNGRW